MEAESDNKLDLAKVQRFVRMTRKKKELEAAAKALGKIISALGDEIELDLALSGLRNLPITVDDEESTVYTWTQDQPELMEGVTKEMVGEALKKHGVDLVQELYYDSRSFGSWVRELDVIPDWLGELVDIKTVTKVRMRS